MKFKNLLHILCGTALTVVAGGVVQSCSDEIEVDIPDYTVAGQTVTVSVPVKLPQMEKQSRANLSERDLNTVESLWIRTYSETTGQATSDWVKLTPGTEDTEVGRKVEIVSQSGYNYIIGVANVYTNKGVTKDNPTATPQPLSDLLDQANTWQDFLNIAVVSPSTYNDVNAPVAPLPMAGCYTNILPGGTHPTNVADWASNNFTPYFIPTQKGVISLNNGAIHMRRLVSQINFVVKANNDNVMDVTVNSYTVYNAPKYSWLYERPSADGQLANFGDVATEDNKSTYYTNIPQYGSQYIEKDNSGVSTFNFWQGENKHEALSGTVYTDRDKYSNGLFTSLTGDSWTPNNMASFVIFSCTVNYRSQLNVNEEGEIMTDNSGTNMYRTGYADYLVHLGYIQGNNEQEKSRDFNCYRNTNCTYTVTVNGLDDIRVDAYDETIPYPGESGIVSDLSNATIELDAHYHAFNIELTESDIQEGISDNGNEGFGFLIASYKDGEQYIFDESTDLTSFDENLYNWVELRKTTNEATLAEYKPRYGTYKSDQTFSLVELNKKLKAGELTAGWYTVFVNEYTYEDMYMGDNANNYGNEASTTARPKWMGYVNQDPRRFYIKVTQKKSEDGTRIYARSKYGISQRSIQTYYSDQVFTPAEGTIPRGTAIGTERFNETEGLNVRSTDRRYGTSGSNGRFNIAQYLSGSTSTELSINNSNQNSRPLWSSFVDQTKPMQIPAVTGTRAQGGPELPARTVANHNAVKLPKLVDFSGTRTATFSDPQNTTNAAYYMEAYNACMSRNRDNNGNGRIDPEELRWYIPAMGKYLRLLLGANSLSEPVMDFNSVTKLPFVTSSTNEWNGTTTYSWSATGTTVLNDYISRYMFVTSDENKVLWAMEGMSTSTWDQAYGWGGNQTHPWQVRCIRNLGTDMRQVTDGEKVTMAYVVDASQRTVTMTYYDQASIRASAYTGNGNGNGQMPVHIITSDANMVFRKFQYDSQDLGTSPSGRPTGDNTTDSQWQTYAEGIQTYINGNPCSVRNAATGLSGWRIPNQKELAIMRNIGVLTGGGVWLTCTANYFNTTTGSGGSYTNGQNRFMVMLSTHGTLLTTNNLKQNLINVRCVRDVQ